MEIRTYEGTFEGTDEALDPDEFMAECRRYPPVRNEAKARECFAMYDRFSGPIVQAMNWCGEWRGTAPAFNKLKDTQNE